MPSVPNKCYSETLSNFEAHIYKSVFKIKLVINKKCGKVNTNIYNKPLGKGVIYIVNGMSAHFHSRHHVKVHVQ